MRVVCVDSWTKVRPVVEYSVWGSSRNLFSKVTKGEVLVLLVAREGVVVGTAQGSVQQSDLMVWTNDLFEWRVPLGDVQVHKGTPGRALNAGVRAVLSEKHREGYGWLLRNQQSIDEASESRISALLLTATADPRRAGVD